MTKRPAPRSRRAVIAAGFACVLAPALLGLGCGGAGDVAAVPVSGTITYKGKPIAKGTLQLLPEVGKGASGEIVDGKFTLSTYGDRDGAIPGKHKVGVVSATEVKTKDNDVGLKYDIPQGFASPDGSGLEVTIPKGGLKDLSITLE